MYGIIDYDILYTCIEIQHICYTTALQRFSYGFHEPLNTDPIMLNLFLSKLKKILGMSLPLFIKGFTLIELLVVISILSLLASIILASLNSVRRNARNVVRIANLHTMNKVFKIYEGENNKYPLAEISTREFFYGSIQVCAPGQCFMITAQSNQGIPGPPGGGNFSWSQLASAVNEYLSVLPLDPMNGSNFFYVYKIFVDSSGKPLTYYFKPVGGSCVIGPTPVAGSIAAKGYLKVRREGVTTNSPCGFDQIGTGWEYMYFQ